MERFISSNYASVFLWGLGVLFGMIGFGRLIARAVGGESAKNAGWGLHAVWGMSVYLFVGGALSVVGACGSTAILLLIGLGLAMFIWTTVRGGIPDRAALAGIPWKAWPAFAVVALVYSGGIYWQRNVEPCDDLAAYYNFCERLLSTGSFGDPFSWRRLASLGGHTLLQCSVLARGSYANAQAFEVGICPVILLGLVLGFRGGALGRSPLGLLIGLIAVTTPIFRVNTASHLTGAVMLLGLFATLDLAERTADRRLRFLIVAGVVAAGLCSLRAQYVPAAGGALGFFWLASWMKDRGPWREAVIEAGCWGGALFAALLPWMIACFLSNRSPLYPLFQGDNNPEFNPLLPNQPLLARLALPVQMILNPALLPLLLCLLAAPNWRRGLAVCAVSLAGVLASLALAYSITFAPDEVTVPRYVQPLLYSSALAALMAAAVSPRRRLMAWVFGALVIGTSVQQRCEYLQSHYDTLALAGRLRMPFGVRAIADYRGAQTLIPEGKRIVVCTDFPFLFDHTRNPIWTIDMPHAASPAPGLPFHKPPEETKSYLRSLGVEYLIVVDFGKSFSLYQRASWQKHAMGDVPLWKIQAPFYLDFFDTADGLAASETALGNIGNLRVIQLKP